eukprot:9495927-Pyramimonas_sp.AAC.1
MVIVSPRLHFGTTLTIVVASWGHPPKTALTAALLSAAHGWVLDETLFFLKISTIENEQLRSGSSEPSAPSAQTRALEASDAKHAGSYILAFFFC